MRILYSPVFTDKRIEYQFDGEVIIASINGQSDTFDFTEMPDGLLLTVDTILPINPIVEAKRENGVLSVILTNFIGQEATDEERFPEWQVVS